MQMTRIASTATAIALALTLLVPLTTLVKAHVSGDKGSSTVSTGLVTTR